MHVQINKEWGHYKDIFRDSKVVFKELVVHPNEEMSYQYHNKRTEFWFVYIGTATITIDGREFNLNEGKSITILPYTRHRIANRTSLPLIVFEMQCGECSEEDIVRLEDKYGR